MQKSKKILSVTLALIMVLGVMVVGVPTMTAGAAGGAAPVSLKSTAYNSNATVTIGWQKGSGGATGYQIAKKKLGDKSYSYIYVGGNTKSYNDKSVVCGTIYYYQVRSVYKVGKNTNYFLMVFNRVKQFGRSKFNFGAFLFSGVYFLYRKMYLPGIIFSLLIIATNVLATYIRLTPEYISASNEVISYINNRSAMSSYDALMITNKIWIIYAPELLTWVRYGIMLFSGFLANRIYLGHCVKGIKKVKAQNQGENINDKLTAKGGVNLPLALSFGIAIVVILFICEYFQLTVI